MALTLLNLNTPVVMDSPDLSLGVVLRDAAQVQRLRAEEQTARVAESVAPELFSLLAGDGEDAKFRRITSPATLRDLNPVMHDRMQAVCFYLSVTTPFGKRIIRIMVDHIVGEGFKVSAEDPAVQEVADRFWKDSTNNMDENVDALCQEILTFGELCIPVAVNPIDGMVRLGYIDPQNIDSVEFALMQTASGQEITTASAVLLRERVGEVGRRRLEIIHVDEDPNSPTFGEQKGDCFYFAINKAKSASRGISELFALADWVDVFDQMVFDYADRVRLLNSFVWDYTVKGADQPAVDAMQKRVTKSPPRQGGVQVHNDQLSIEARTPDLKGADMSEAARVVKQYGLGGAGMPSWFFADPGDANRAVAQEMAGPTGKMLTNKQNMMKRIITAIVDFAIGQARVHGVLGSATDLTWKLQVPDISVQDTGLVATALQAMANALGMAEDRGWIRGETSARAFQSVLTQVGVEVDQDEYDQAQQEKQDRQAQNQNALDPQANLADALKKAALKKMPPATSVTQ
jgi:hypothetical protein